jgi:dihydrofolate reductase
MGEVQYTAIASLDGYVADTNGNFDWAAPDEEVHRFANDLERDVGTHLLGRRMYEVMRFWDTPEAVDDQPEVVREFAELWRDTDKVVFSRQLAEVTEERTTLERAFSPDVVRAMKARSDRSISVGGPTLAAAAFAAGLVDRLILIVVPVIVGGGTRAFPGGRVDLELVDERRFEHGTVALEYRVR